MIKHAPDVISKEQISEDVLGRRLASFDRSIDMHVSNIRKKIAEHIEGDKIKTMRERVMSSSKENKALRFSWLRHPRHYLFLKCLRGFG